LFDISVSGIGFETSEDVCSEMNGSSETVGDKRFRRLHKKIEIITKTKAIPPRTPPTMAPTGGEEVLAPTTDEGTAVDAPGICGWLDKETTAPEDVDIEP